MDEVAATATATTAATSELSPIISKVEIDDKPTIIGYILLLIILVLTSPLILSILILVAVFIVFSK